MRFKYSVVFCVALAWTVLAEDVLLKCDESDSTFDTPDTFCTVTGFYVTHSHNVKFTNHTRSNMAKFMKFYDSRLLYLPFKIFEYFPYLRTFDVSSTEILDIPRNSFASANNLSYLNMSNNNITAITTSVFIGANSLIRIDLSRNFIEELNENSFRGLGKIDRIMLADNRIKTLSKDIFVENLYLEYVLLKDNLLESIDPEVFSRLQRIREVNLANNKLITLHPDTFKSAYGIETLILSGNQLSEFNLTDKSILLRLELDNNKLTSLVINSTKTVRAENNTISSITTLNSHFLEKLILGRNRFTDISNITNLTTLQALDLSYNRIGPLKIVTFDKMRRLKELYLRSTNISQISFGMFSKQTSLEVLDLSFNNISELNLNIFFPYMSKIKNFFIDGNNLTEIHGKSTFAYAFPNLVKIGLSKNQFNCSYLHTILSPPYLSSFVELHIEPEFSTEESTHIRDITCISNRRNPDNPPSIPVEESEIEILRSTVINLNKHARHLTFVLILFTILLTIAIFTVVFVFLIKYANLYRRRYSGQFGRNGSIVFRSNTTMNNNFAMER